MSTIIGTLRIAPASKASALAAVSVGLPAAKGTTMEIGLLGKPFLSAEAAVWPKAAS
jgi:hypothetical protein